MFIWNLYKASLAMVERCVKTDILVEPEVKGSEQLYKEIYMVIHTAYIVYTM